MALIPTLNIFVAGTQITSAAFNQNFAFIRDELNSKAVFTDVARTFTALQTFEDVAVSGSLSVGGVAVSLANHNHAGVYLPLTGGTLTGSLNVAVPTGVTGMEIGRGAGDSPYLDFHTSAAADYDLRLQAVGNVLHVKGGNLLVASGEVLATAGQLNVRDFNNLLNKPTYFDAAKVIISTAGPSGTPATGVGTLWCQVA